MERGKMARIFHPEWGCHLNVEKQDAEVKINDE